MRADIYTIGGKPCLVRLDEGALIVNLAVHAGQGSDIQCETIIEPQAKLACFLAEKVKQPESTGNPLVDELRAVVKQHEEKTRQVKKGQSPSSVEKSIEPKPETEQSKEPTTKEETPEKVKQSGAVAEALYRLLSGSQMRSDEVTLNNAGWTIRS